MNFSSRGVCRSCETSAADIHGKIVRQYCPARKIWEFGTDKVTIYHYDNHTCTAKTAVQADDAENHFLQNPGAKPCGARNAVLGDLIRNNTPLSEVERTANQFIDRKRLSRVKKKLVGDRYEAVAKMKKERGMF